MGWSAEVEEEGQAAGGGQAGGGGRHRGEGGVYAPAPLGTRERSWRRSPASRPPARTQTHMLTRTISEVIHTTRGDSGQLRWWA